MKGLLHRLAARAAGTTVPVRSDARLAFGGADLAWGETIEIEAAPQPSVGIRASDPAQAREAQAREAARPSGQPDGSEHEAPAPMLHRQSTPSPRPAPLTDLQPPASPATSPAALWASAGPPDPRLPPRLVEGRSADGMQAPPTHAEPRDEPAGLASPPSLRPDTALRSNGEPSLLMPRVVAERAPTPAGRLSAAARGPVWPNVAAQAVADEPTEVHIHIGRIEVTAVHEAPAPRIQPKGRHAPMSLDAYLAARSKA